MARERERRGKKEGRRQHIHNGEEQLALKQTRETSMSNCSNRLGRGKGPAAISVLIKGKLVKEEKNSPLSSGRARAQRGGSSSWAHGITERGLMKQSVLLYGRRGDGVMI